MAVELIIKSVNEGVQEYELQQSLGKLYGKNPDDFAPLIRQVLGLKMPYTLLSNISKEEADKHIARLSKLGLVCEAGFALALVPVAGEETINEDGEVENKAGLLCPSCNERSSDETTCSACGVVMNKISSQQKTDEAMQNQLGAAKQALENKKNREQQDAEKRRIQAEKDEAEREKNKQLQEKTTEQKHQKDVFTAEYADEDAIKRKKLVGGGVALVLTAGIAAFLSGAFQSDNPDEVVADAQATEQGEATTRGPQRPTVAAESFEESIAKFEARADASAASAANAANDPAATAAHHKKALGVADSVTGAGSAEPTMAADSHATGSGSSGTLDNSTVEQATSDLQAHKAGADSDASAMSEQSQEMQDMAAQLESDPSLKIDDMMASLG